MLKEKTHELDGIILFGECTPVTVLGGFMGPEVKRDIVSS